jgi:hypothetical protein
MHVCSLGIFSSVYLHAWRRETGAYLLAQAGVIRAGAKPATNQPECFPVDKYGVRKHGRLKLCST